VLRASGGEYVVEGGGSMTITHKDVEATALTVLVVLVYAATHEEWGVPLIGDSHRWAAGAIMLLGMATCGRGTMSNAKGTATKLLAGLGIVALVLAVLALWTASLTWLSLLVVDIVLLWALSTLRHAWHLPGRPVAT
jgi:hypothetical protein